MSDERTKRPDAAECGEKLPKLPPLPEVPVLPELTPDQHPPRTLPVPEAPRLAPNLPPREQKRKLEEGASQYGKMGIAYAIPMALVVPIIALTIAGWWLDERFHKSPFFTLGGALVGTVAGFMNMFRMVSKLND